MALFEAVMYLSVIFVLIAGIVMIVLEELERMGKIKL